jgi:hypothetical protein
MLPYDLNMKSLGSIVPFCKTVKAQELGMQHIYANTVLALCSEQGPPGPRPTACTSSQGEGISAEEGIWSEEQIWN